MPKRSLSSDVLEQDAPSYAPPAPAPEKKTITKQFEVVQKSFINGTICHGGEIVSMEVEPDFVPGSNLKEYTGPWPLVPAAPQDAPSGQAGNG